MVRKMRNFAKSLLLVIATLMLISTFAVKEHLQPSCKTQTSGIFTIPDSTDIIIAAPQLQAFCLCVFSFYFILISYLILI